jgi:hypothetical protein
MTGPGGAYYGPVGTISTVGVVNAMPAGQPVKFTAEQRRMFFYGPDWTIESDIVSRADASAAPIPTAELLEAVGRWPDEAAVLAAKVTVPVQYLAFVGSSSAGGASMRTWCAASLRTSPPLHSLSAS